MTEKNINLSKFNLIYQCIFSVLIFLIPSNLFLKFAEQSAYVNGLLVDYLLPKLSASDIVIFFFFGAATVEFFLERNGTSTKKVATTRSFTKKNSPTQLPVQWRTNWRQWQNFLPIIFLGVLLFFRQFGTAKPLASIWFFCKLLEIILLSILLLRKKFLFPSVATFFTVLGTLAFQSLLAIYQFSFQRPLVNSYLFLGEPNLNHPLFLAKASFNGVEKILPYGTTAHPNILGGFLALGILFIVWRGRARTSLPQTLLSFLIAIPTLWALYLTQSVSAWATFIIGIIFLALFRYEKIGQKNSSF
jgi:hypothetical protein